MTRSVTVNSLIPQPDQPYDLFVASLGFETRARFLLSRFGQLATKKVACGFESRKEHSYRDNYNAFRSAGFEVADHREEDFAAWWTKILGAAVESRKGNDRALRLCVDVSSMSRYRMATIVGSFLELNHGPPIIADFLYSVAVFSQPPQDGGGPIAVCAPATSVFSGWWTEPEQPSVVVFGLGYEEGKAVGALEYLEPKLVWAFRPTGEDRRYDAALELANANLWDVVPRQNIISYQVDRPFECFSMLESLSYGNTVSSRVTLVPLGPKIFSLCCLLVASVQWPKVAVWRVSSGQNEPALDRRPSGKVIAIRAAFQATAT
jgi:hypothetical protein